MSSKRILFLIVCVFGCQVLPGETRLSSYGSNPYLSWAMFPQDIQAWQSNMLFYFPTYDKQPYWGSIDQPKNKPNGNYTSTGIDVSDNNASFSHTAKIYSVTNSIGYVHRLRAGPMALLNINEDVEARVTHAEGELNSTNSGRIPFNYSLTHALNSLHLQGILAFEAFGIPSGLQLSTGFENTLLLSHNFDFTKGGTAYSTDRAVWGWSTSPCAHIFGARGVQGDAWLQNGYVRGPLYNIDLQGGVTLPKGKFGGRVAYRAGRQDYYEWTRDSTISTGDAVLDVNFEGTYKKGDWSETTSDFSTGLYGNITCLKGQRYSLNTFARLKYEGLAQEQVLSSNPDISNNAKDNVHSFSIEAAPNISIPFDPYFNYIDVALVAGYCYSRFDNTDMYWVGGGQIEASRNSTTSAGDETIWEPYSYANRNVLNCGLDISTMFPVMDNAVHKLGLGMTLLINSKFTFMTKYYGTNVQQGADLNFRVDNQRQDYERELQFATGIKAQYVRRPYLFWFEITEPLLHSLLPRTRVTDAGGNNILYEHEKSPLWLSQEGIRFSLFLSVEMSLPFLGLL